jgi:diacylglycerol kinase family enzyme
MGVAEVCVIFNPAAGRGLAARRLESLRRALGKRAEFRPTSGPGHAEELARQAAQEGFPLIGAAGGDGTLHEVANGLLRVPDSPAALAVYPTGSANDYAYSLGLPPEWWAAPDFAVTVRPVDVGLARAPDGRERHFLNALGLGLNGAVNLESRRIRRLRGLPRYGLALLRTMWSHFNHPVMTVTLDGTARTAPTLAFSVALGCREGNFLLAPHAQLDDGYFDYLHAGPVPRWELLRYVPALIAGGLPDNHPRLWQGRCRAVRLTSEAPLIAHVDGEFFTLPEDGIRKLDVRMLAGRLRVQAATGRPLSVTAASR